MTAALSTDMPTGPAGAEVSQLRAERDLARAEVAALRVLVRRHLGRLRDLSRAMPPGALEPWIAELEGALR